MTYILILYLSIFPMAATSRSIAVTTSEFLGLEACQAAGKATLEMVKTKDNWERYHDQNKFICVRKGAEKNETQNQESRRP